jgi:hypothetical protein
MVATTGPIDCACVIHGQAYAWTYVERLYNMLNRHITPGIRLHVYTESDRPVPAPMIKHVLTDWGISGPKQSWWYKMQLFNREHHAGPLLYFDLDTVITNNVDWIWQLPTEYFWAVRDFKYLWRPTYSGLNSSVMWWDTNKHAHVWNQFIQEDLPKIMRKHHGDQDYISANIPVNQRRFFELDRVKSWRWQCVDGGYDFKKKRHIDPNSTTYISPETSVVIFHGQPKPAEIADPAIVRYWR